MKTPGLCFLVVLSFLQFCLSADVIQTPKLWVVHPKTNTTMICHHDDSYFDYKYWYYMEKEKGPVLIGYVYKTSLPNYEKDFKDKEFTIEGVDDRSSILNTSEVSPENSGIYFCASSVGQGASTERQYFGAGTILSVLENGEERKQPEVKVYRPNKKEFKEHNLISLVCVANGFYPEHVRLHWYMNGIKRDNIYPNVPQLNSDNKTYFTSKRLSLTRSEYFNPQNTFKCVAGFIDDESGKINDEIMGEADCSVSREQYGMSINQGKISYIMVMCKSGLYGIIVLFIIWRRKVIAASK